MNESLSPAELLALKKEILSFLHCALPGIVESFDAESGIATVPFQKGDKEPSPISLFPLKIPVPHDKMIPEQELIPMRIYLDNCCYNRPYDDQTQTRVSLEAQAKLHIQEEIREDKYELAASYMLTYENSRNQSVSKREAIDSYISSNTVVYIDASQSSEAEAIAEAIASTGVKPADSIHTACAILARCDYMITTDDRLLKYQDNRIRIVDPTEFVRLTEGSDDNA